ncbi:MAG: hypothetical protein AAF624_00625 [Bacteroidota bacterium]
MTVERAHRILDRIEPGCYSQADVERLLPFLRAYVGVALAVSHSPSRFALGGDGAAVSHTLATGLATASPAVACA